MYNNSMQAPSPEIKALFEQALAYDRQGDPYNAIKLYKRLIKLAPDWAPPFARLGMLYKYRREWKPALHYCKKAVVLEPGNQMAWWTIGIAATAQRRWRTAQRVWKKFGFSHRQKQGRPISIRLKYGRQFELLWADPIDPARACIANVPHPASGRRFQDLVLYDNVVAGHHVLGARRFPVYDELGVFKASVFHTFSCILHTEAPEDVRQLEKICRKAGLGFENWSNAARLKTAAQPGSLPEYFGPEFWQPADAECVIAAIAAPDEGDVLRVLSTWEVITLQTYSDLERHL